MPECSSRCVDTCAFTGIRECLHSTTYKENERHRAAIAAGEYLTMVSDVTFTDGKTGPCYALVSQTGSATAVTIKRAIKLQEIGYPFSQPHPVYPADFSSWYGPDFKSLGGDTMRAFVERTPESIEGGE